MKILQVAHRLPYPLIDGGKKGIYGFTANYSALVGRHNFGLFCLAPREEQGTDLNQLRLLTSILHVHFDDFRNRVPPLIVNTLFNWKYSYNIAKYISNAYLADLFDVIEQFKPDVIQFEHLHTAWYARNVRLRFPQIMLSLREHNVESTIMERLAENESHPVKRAIFAVQSAKIRRWEAEALGFFDLVLPITSQDAVRISAMNNSIPQLLTPAGTEIASQLPSESSGDGKFHILHLSSMEWLPNVEGLERFISEVMPFLRQASGNVVLDVVGKGMPPSILKHACADIVVHGFVPDLEPLLRQANIAVVPIQVGGGMRVKILDLMAQGIPVVSTSVGAEGISNGDDGCLLIADQASDFARQILFLKANEPARQEIRLRAFNHCQQRYSWSAITKRVFECYSDFLHR